MAKILDDKTFNSAYSTEIANLVDKAVNRQEFQYNPANDQAYQAYAKEYTRLGNQAAKNTLADVAAQTGGNASSYAVTAANQSRNDYNQALMGKMPQLMEAAYNKYINEANMNLNMIGTLQGLDEADYNRFAQDRAFDRDVYESDRDYDYQVGRDAVADAQWQTQFDYQKGRDQRADEQWDKEFGWKVSTDERNFNYQAGRDAVADAQWEETFQLEVDRLNEEKNQFMMNYKLSEKELNEKIREYDLDRADSNAQNEFANMLAQWELSGKASKKVAKYFGVKTGTPTSDQAYKTAQIALDQASLQLQRDEFNFQKSQASKGSGSGGGSNGSRSGSSGSSRSSSSGSGNKQSAGYKDVYYNAKGYKYDEGLQSYLNKQVDAGTITGDEATYIYTVLGGNTSPESNKTNSSLDMILSEGEFNRSTSMQQKYGSYANYKKQMLNKK